MGRTIVMRRAAGRHRFGTPGLVHVSAFVTVHRTGIFASLMSRLRRRPAAAVHHRPAVVVPSAS